MRRLYPVVHRRVLGAWVGTPTAPTCPAGEFWDGTQCRGSIGTAPGGTGVPTPAPAPAPAPAPTSAPAPQPNAGTPTTGAAPQQTLIACINGPDLYDVYNPGMTLVAKAVLNPNASYPNAQIDFPKGPPCPVPQATGVGGLCDIPAQYLAPKDPTAPMGKPVLACYIPNHGVLLIDYVTGAPIGTHLSGACLSLLSDVTVAQDGDPRCAGAAAAVGATPTPAPAPTPPPPTGTSPTPPPLPTPPSDITSAAAAAASGSIPTQPIMAPQVPGGTPWAGYGSPIGMAPPGYGGGIPAQPMPAPALMPPSQRMACENALKPKTLKQWIEDCPGVKKARGY